MARTKQTARKVNVPVPSIIGLSTESREASPERPQVTHTPAKPRTRAAAKPRAKAAAKPRAARKPAAKKGLAPAETYKACNLANLPLIFKGVHDSFPSRFRGRMWHEMVMEQQRLGRSGLFTRKSQYRLFESYVLWGMVYTSHAALPAEDSSESSESE